MITLKIFSAASIVRTESIASVSEDKTEITSRTSSVSVISDEGKLPIIIIIICTGKTWVLPKFLLLLKLHVPRALSKSPTPGSDLARPVILTMKKGFFQEFLMKNHVLRAW